MRLNRYLLLSPFCLWTVTWIITLSLFFIFPPAQVNPIYFFKKKEFLIFLLATIFFGVGALVPLLAYFNKIHSVESKVLFLEFKKSINAEKLYYFLLFLYFFYFVGYIADTMESGYIPFFFEGDKEWARQHFGAFLFHLGTDSIFVVLYLSFIFNMLSTNKYKKNLIKIFSIIGFILYFLTLNRMHLIFALISIFLTMFLFKRISILKISIYLSLMFLILVGILLYRVSQYNGGLLYLKNYADVESSNLLTIIFINMIYYININVLNIVNLIQNIHDNYWGIYTFRWFITLTGIKFLDYDFFENLYYPYLFQSIQYRGYNTFTFFKNLYLDFGTIGGLIASYLLGFLYGVFHVYIIKKKYILPVYMLLINDIIFSFFSLRISLVNFTPLILVAMIGLIWSRKTKKNKYSNIK